MKNLLSIALLLLTGFVYAAPTTPAVTGELLLRTSVGPFGWEWTEDWYNPGPTMQVPDTASF